MIEMTNYSTMDGVDINRYVKIVAILRDDDRKTLLVTLQRGYLENDVFFPAVMLARREGRFKIVLDNLDGAGAEFPGNHFDTLLQQSTTKEDFRISDIEDVLISLSIVVGSRVV